MTFENVERRRIFQRFYKFLKICFFKKKFFRIILKLVFFYKVAIGFEPNCVTNGNKSSWTQANQISFLSRNRPIESNPPLFS